MLKRIFLSLLVFACAFTARAAPNADDFRAVIAAPKEIQLANTGSLSIIMAIQRLKEGAPLPTKFWLWTTVGILEVNQFVDGRWQTKRGPSPLEIDAWQIPQTAKIILDADFTGRPTLRVDVTTAEPSHDLLGSAEIRLLHPKQIEFTDVPSVIRADGKSTESITVRVTGEQAQAIDNVALLLRGDFPPDENGLSGFINITATTDKQGYATFTLPASKRSGIALLQLFGVGAATQSGPTQQLEIHYENSKPTGEKSLLEDPNWWKKPVLW